LLRAEGLELNQAARTVMQNGKKVELTDVEFALLEALMRSPGKVVAREDISENVLGRKFHPFDRSLDMHVSRLRRKLAENGAPEEQVKTIRGVGYQLTVNFNPQPAGDGAKD
jgi:two-component system response regulator CpxR